MQIATSELRRVVTRLLDHLDHAGQAALTIDNDYYWSIPPRQRYDPHKKPVKLTLGQLSDDWSELKKILEGQSEPIGYALVWFSAILRAIGEENAG